MMKIRPHRNAHPGRSAKRRSGERQRIPEVIDVRHHHERNLAVAARDIEEMPEIAEKTYVADLRQPAPTLHKRSHELDLPLRPVVLLDARRERVPGVFRVRHDHAPIPRLDISGRSPLGIAPAVSGEIRFNNQDSAGQVINHGRHSFESAQEWLRIERYSAYEARESA